MVKFVIEAAAKRRPNDVITLTERRSLAARGKIIAITPPVMTTVTTDRVNCIANRTETRAEEKPAKLAFEAGIMNSY